MVAKTVNYKGGSRKKRFSPFRAIRYKCIDCCSGSWNEVKLCPAKDCSLWEFRFGKNPTAEVYGEAIKEDQVWGKDKNFSDAPSSIK